MERQKLEMGITIDASPETIWDVLLQDETYKEWTSVFHPGSYAETDWKQGSKVLFKTPEGDGMVSKVAIHKPNEIISFEHLGILKDGREDYDSEEVKKWQGSRETYTLSQKEKGTRLQVEQDIDDSHAEWFQTTWEKALQKVKELAETRS